MKNERTSLEGEERDGSLEVLNMYLAELIAGGDGTTATPELIDDLQSRSILQEPGHVAAENWLRSLGVEDTPERIILPHEQRLAHPFEENDLVLEEEALLSVYPSPAKPGQPVYFVARLQDGMEQGVVRIMDPAGRLVSEQRVASRMGVVEVPTDNLSSGLYVAGLTVDVVTVASAKFQLTR